MVVRSYTSSIQVVKSFIAISEKIYLLIFNELSLKVSENHTNSHEKLKLAVYLHVNLIYSVVEKGRAGELLDNKFITSLEIHPKLSLLAIRHRKFVWREIFVLREDRASCPDELPRLP